MFKITDLDPRSLADWQVAEEAEVREIYQCDGYYADPSGRGEEHDSDELGSRPGKAREECLRLHPPTLRRTDFQYQRDLLYLERSTGAD